MHHETKTSHEIESAIESQHRAEVEQIQANLAHLSEEEKVGSNAGPTGRFPDGKLTENDEGELAIELGILKGKVVINFGKPVASIGLDPVNALRLANQIRGTANKIRHDQYESAATIKRQQEAKK